MPTPRKPTNLKILHGDRGDRINRDEPMPTTESIEPPFELSERARRVWDRIVPSMTSQKVLTDWDVDQLAVFCDAAAMYQECRGLLVSEQNDEMPRFIEKGSAGGRIKSPYWQMMRDCQAMMTAVGSRYGLTPADRTKLTTDTDSSSGDLDDLVI